MPKRFIDTDAHKTELRRLDLKTRFTFDWLWRNCDCAGVWQTDPELFRFEAGFTLNLEGLLKSCPWVKRLSNGNVFLPEFVQVNYGELKPGYNPHKPVFRSLEANGIEPLTLHFEDLPKTCRSLEGEEEGEEEGEGEYNSGKKGTREAPEIWPSFADWWKLYAKGSRKLSSEQWAKLSKQDREAAFFATRAYIDSRPDPRYRKDGERFLRHRTWEDPIIDNSTPKTANNGPHITKPSSLSEADKINAALAILQRNDAHHG